MNEKTRRRGVPSEDSGIFIPERYLLNISIDDRMCIDTA